MEADGAGVELARAISGGDHFPVSLFAAAAGFCIGVPLTYCFPLSASSATTGRPSPALAASSLNKFRQLSYLLPHLHLGSCGGGGSWLGGAQAKPQGGGTQEGSCTVRLAPVYLIGLAQEPPSPPLPDRQPLLPSLAICWFWLSLRGPLCFVPSLSSSFGPFSSTLSP